ncbi:DUF3267 domain-containing protein [Alkalicoccobacillus gibsonii]|uniref:DUF3267 domain-containing protein n=1 Tax=Alkalicoccobacillus gibsonii TaxID=79881 RepID=A0ABU9VDC0_9BACI
MFIIYWFRHLPQLELNRSEWTPFIHNAWFRQHYMKFVYVFLFLVLSIPFQMELGFSKLNISFLILIGISTFIVHEWLHIVTVYNKGDMSLTFTRVFFWLHTNAVLSKPRFFLFMSSPFILLSIIPGLLSFFTSGEFQIILLFICWINTLYSASDIFNSVLILKKPQNSKFLRGFYKIDSVR